MHLVSKLQKSLCSLTRVSSTVCIEAAVSHFCIIDRVIWFIRFHSDVFTFRSPSHETNTCRESSERIWFLGGFLERFLFET